MTEIGDELPKGAINLGGDHWYVKVTRDNGEWVGIEEFHRHPGTGKWCGGWAPFRLPDTIHPQAWDVQSYEPLTLSPSLLCTVCGNHGFIREGKWMT